MPQEHGTFRKPGNPFERTPREDEKKQEDILKAVDAVLERVRSEAPELPRKDVVAIVGRIMEHSTLDGVKTVEQLRLTPKEAFGLCCTPEYAHKHPLVFDALMTFAQQNDLKKEYNQLKIAEQTLDQTKGSESLKLETAEARELYTAIDGAYADLLWSTRQITYKGRRHDELEHLLNEAVRRLESRIGRKSKTRETKTDPNRVIESYLGKLSLAFEGGYYAGPVRDKMEEMVSDADKQSEQYQYHLWRLSTDLQIVTASEIGKICSDLSLDEEGLLKAIRHDRYVLYPQLLNYERTVAKAEAKKLVEQSLGPGEKLEFDAETNRYAIVEHENDGPEPDLEYEEIPFEGFKLINQVISVAGKIFIYGQKGLEYGIFDLNGKHMDGVDPVEFKGKVYWISGNSIMSEEGVYSHFPQFSSIRRLKVINGALHFIGVKIDRNSLIEQSTIFRIDGPNTSVGLRHQGPPYSRKEDLAEIDGRIAFTASQGLVCSIYDHEGHVLDRDNGIESPHSIHSLIQLGDRIFFGAISGKDYKMHLGDTKGADYGQISSGPIKAGEHVYYLQDGKILDEQGRAYGQDYAFKDHVFSLGGKLAFTSEKDGKQVLVVEKPRTEKPKRREYHFPQYSYVSEPKVLNGKLCFVAGLSNGKEILCNVEGDECSGQHDEINGAIEGEGELILEVVDDGKASILGTSGKRYGKGYINPNSPVLINGVLYYSSQRSESDANEILHDSKGKVIGLGYDSASDPNEVNGVLCFTATLDGKTFIDAGRTYGKKYDKVSTAFEYKGKLCFLATKDGQEMLVDQDDKILIGPYESINSWCDIGEDLFAEVEKDGRSIIVDQNKQEYGNEYDQVDNPDNLNGHLVYGAFKDGKSIIVVEGEEPDRQQESELLDLLNTLHDPDKERVERHLLSILDQKVTRTQKDLTENSFVVAKGLNEAIRDIPEAFLATLGARRDRSSAKMADKLASVMFPKEYRRSNWDKQGGLLGFLKGAMTSLRSEAPRDVSNLLTSQESDPNLGGSMETSGDEREIMEFREPIKAFMVTNLLGSYRDGAWHKVYIPLPRSTSGNTHETTVSIPNVRKGQMLDLPVPIDAVVIPERVRGVHKGQEVPLEPRQDSLGLYRTERLPDVEKVAYSVTLSDSPETLPQATQQEIEHLRSNFERNHGQEMTRTLATLPEEVSAFLESDDFLDLEPRQKLMAIERFVREAGYYDFSNKEVARLKLNNSLEDKLTICELRLEDLKSKRPNDPAFKGKRWAGVCADFAEIACVMLRKAGFVSGIATGFSVDGKSAKAKNAHATSFVLWPDGRGGLRPVIIDSTPSGDDPRLADIALPTLAQKETEAQRQAETARTEAREELKELLTAAEDGSKALEQIDNGKLERLTNLILAGSVRGHNLAVVKEMLNLYRYGGLYKLDPLRQKVEIKQTMEEYLLNRPEQNLQKSNKAPGTQLFQEVEEFVRYVRRKGGSLEEALNILTFIKDQAKDALDMLESPGVHKKTNKPLPGTTELALTAAIQYLRGKNISGHGR